MLVVARQAETTTTLSMPPPPHGTSQAAPQAASHARQGGTLRIPPPLHPTAADPAPPAAAERGCCQRPGRGRPPGRGGGGKTQGEWAPARLCSLVVTPNESQVVDRLERSRNAGQARLLAAAVPARGPKRPPRRRLKTPNSGHDGVRWSQDRWGPPCVDTSQIMVEKRRHACRETEASQVKSHVPVIGHHLGHTQDRRHPAHQQRQRQRPGTIQHTSNGRAIIRVAMRHERTDMLPLPLTQNYQEAYVP